MASHDSLGLPVLLPGLDFLNHSPTARVAWDWGPTTCAIRTDAELSEGHQIFNNYGPKSNEECLCHLLFLKLIEGFLLITHSVLLGYGFCLPSNPADTFNLSYSPALTHMIRTARAEPHPSSNSNLMNRATDSSSEAPASKLEQLPALDIHSVRLVSNATDHQGVAQVDAHTETPSYTFSNRFLGDFSLALCNERERRGNEAFQTLPADLTSFSSNTLSRNKLTVLSTLAMILQDKWISIRRHDHDLLPAPIGRNQEFAAMYRASQLRILEQVLLALENTLVTITSLPLPGTEPSASDKQRGTHRPLNRVVRLGDVLGGATRQANDTDIILPKQLKHSLRAIIHAGLGTRDPTRIARLCGEEFTFSMWLCGLSLLTSNDPNPDMRDWLEKLRKWYPKPELSCSDSQQSHRVENLKGSSERNRRDGNGLNSRHSRPTGEVSPEQLENRDEKAEVLSMATSYLSAVEATVAKHSGSLFNRPDVVTAQQLAWCLSVVRGEGVRCPPPGTIDEGKVIIEGGGGQKESKDQRRKADERDGDEFVIVVEID